MANSLDNMTDLRPQKDGKTWRWQKAYKQGFNTGYNRLDPKFTQSPTYRAPRVASLYWEAGQAEGLRIKEEEEARKK